MYRLKTTKECEDFESFVMALFSLGHPEMIHHELVTLQVPAPYRLRIKVLYSQQCVNDVIRVS